MRMLIQHKDSDQQILDAYDSRLLFHERYLAPRVKQELDRAILSMARAVTTGNQTFNSERLQHRNNILRILSDSYGRVIPAFGRAAIRNAQGKSLWRVLEYKQDEGLFDDLVRFWINTQGLRHASMISETTVNDVIATIVAQPIGTPNNEIAEAIALRTTLSPGRSQIIASTEVAGAASYANMQTTKVLAQAEGDDVEKKWLANLDERVRANHAAVSGVIVGIDDKFLVGADFMDRPLDPMASAANIINCRCTTRFIIL